MYITQSLVKITYPDKKEKKVKSRLIWLVTAHLVTKVLSDIPEVIEMLSKERQY
jgi:hypothetical protein